MMKVLQRAGWMFGIFLCIYLYESAHDFAIYQMAMRSERAQAIAQYPYIDDVLHQEIAMANPFACGTGSCAGIQGVQTTPSGADPGAGLVLDANGNIGMAATQLESYTWSAAQNYSAIQTLSAAGGGTSANAALNLSGSAPQVFCSNATSCELDFAASTAPAIVFKTTASSGLGSTVINYELIGNNSGSQILLTLAGNGNAHFVAGDTQNDAGNIIAGASANGTGEIRSGNAGNVTGAKGIGAIVAGGAGPYYVGTNCAQSTSNASPSLLTLTGWACKLTSGSASATVFIITYPGSVTLTNAPICVFTDRASGITTEPTCVTSTTQVTITYAVAPGAVSLGDLMLIGDGI